jgi:hypothetical protein
MFAEGKIFFLQYDSHLERYLCRHCVIKIAEIISYTEYFTDFDIGDYSEDDL